MMILYIVVSMYNWTTPSMMAYKDVKEACANTIGRDHASVLKVSMKKDGQIEWSKLVKCTINIKGE